MPKVVGFFFRLYSRILPMKFFALAFTLGTLNVTYRKYIDYRRWMNITVCLKVTFDLTASGDTFFSLFCSSVLQSCHLTGCYLDRNSTSTHSPNSQHFPERWCSILCPLQFHTVSAHLAANTCVFGKTLLLGTRGSPHRSPSCVHSVAAG